MFRTASRILFCNALILFAACSTEETVTTTAEVTPAPVNSELGLRTLSTKPWLVTGGDVLVEVTLPANTNPAQLQVTLNGAPITNQFRAVSPLRQQALLTGLALGDSTLQASLGPNSTPVSLLLTNYPISGPIISGPHEVPFYCQTEEFVTASGESLGAPVDTDCSVDTRVDYVYWSAGEQIFKPWIKPAFNLVVDEQSEQNVQTDDIAQISVNGAEPIPFIVRIETGTVNRAIYEIAMLHDPASSQPDAWNRSERWNGKLVYTHGGGCRGGWYQQGNTTGGVMRQGLFEQGYAVVSSTLNVFGQNCNDLLASETHIMVKERFIEHYGAPIYTIATGGSGGSYQSHQTADNYPGVF